MPNDKRNFVYIGTPTSCFTKQFLPALQNIPHQKFSFICIHQDEFTMLPKNPDFILRCLLSLKNIQQRIKRWSSLMYWSVYCQQHKILFETNIAIHSNELESYLMDSDFVLTAGIRQKFKTQILSAPKNPIVNFHYSLLPAYRGTHPVFWQKQKNDKEFGYTFHQINDKFDRGDILFQHKLSISTEESVSTICDLLTHHASRQLSGLIDHRVTSRPQKEEKASYFSNPDYIQYLSLNTNDEAIHWHFKAQHTHLFILNEKWLIHLENTKSTSGSFINKLKGYILKDGYAFKIKKINYLPPVFYYFALKRYFD